MKTTPPKKSKQFKSFKQCMLRCGLTYLCFTGLCFFSSTALIQLLTAPLLKIATGQHALIATSMFAPVIVPIKLALTFGFFVSLPALLYQCYQFVAPGLYSNERQFLQNTCIIGLLLFYLGTLFAYWALLPLFLHQVLAWTPANVHYMPDFSQCIDWIMLLLTLCGLLFQTPLMTFACLYFRIIDPETLAEKRGLLILAIFTLAMLITPPDVIMQTLVAIPLWGLFELGVALYYLQQKKAVQTSPH
jgi:sec-independent protein translocase protein TatC